VKPLPMPTMPNKPSVMVMRVRGIEFPKTVRVVWNCMLAPETEERKKTLSLLGGTKRRNFSLATGPPVCPPVNFYILGFERSFAKILDNNKIAFHYNKMLGFVPYSELEDSEIARLYVLTKDAYRQKMKVFREKIARITGDATPLSFNDIDFSRVSQTQRKMLYAGFPQPIQEQIDAKFAETGR